MKTIFKFLIVFILIIIFIYVCNISFMPDSIILIQGEKFDLNTLLGLSIKQVENNGTVQASSLLNKEKVSEVGKADFNLSLFNTIQLKEITVNVIPKTKVVPIGKSIGMKLYTDGVLVVGMSEIEGKKPYQNSGIEEGDRIVEINNNQIDTTDELINTVNRSNGEEVKIKYIETDNSVKTTSIKPVKTGNEYKLGLWVRDAAAGVGTLTFYEPESQMYAALGHGITDIDTSELINIASGELVTTNILSIVKGKKGEPGEIRGTIENVYEVGKVYKNTRFGVYGNLTNKNIFNISNNNAIDVASREEVEKGKAEILCELENGNTKNYEIEIQKIFTNNNEDNKSMLIKVTDDELIEKTGGIIQGMSGAPIIQNGKFIGAVTHVLVSNPTQGYAVFADIMIKQMKEVD